LREVAEEELAIRKGGEELVYLLHGKYVTGTSDGRQNSISSIN